MTRTLDEEHPGVSGEELSQALDTHEWATPLHLAVKPKRDPLLGKLRAGDLTRPWSKALTAWYFLWHGGVFHDWSEGARGSEQVLGEKFRPDVVWATFLPTDALVIARRLAERAGCPWYLDLKDAWSYRLPRGIRSLMARRFKSTSGLTANSRFHGMQGERWFKKKAVTLYDGISDAFLNAKQGATTDLFRIVLVGGTYGEEHLARFLEGLRGWLLTLPKEVRASIRFTYAGSDSEAVRSVCARPGSLENLCEVEILGYLPLTQLAVLCAGASVNAYLWLPSAFHHKLLELLVCGRPVIAFPGEHPEAIAIAEEFRGCLYVCHDGQELTVRLSELWQSIGGRMSDPGPGNSSPLGWSAKARILEEALHGWGGIAPPSEYSSEAKEKEKEKEKDYGLL